MHEEKGGVSILDEAVRPIFGDPPDLGTGRWLARYMLEIPALLVLGLPIALGLAFGMFLGIADFIYSMFKELEMPFVSEGAMGIASLVLAAVAIAAAIGAAAMLDAKLSPKTE